MEETKESYFKEKPVSTGRVIYQGVKPFWRTRTNCDVSIVEYTEFDTIEVITYEPSFDREAPRLYLSSAYVISTITETEMEAKMIAAKEIQLRRHRTPDVAQVRSEVLTQFKVDYVLNRLQIADFSPEIKSFKVELKLNYRDDEISENKQQKMDAIIEQHPDLIPFKSPCIYQFSMYVFLLFVSVTLVFKIVFAFVWVCILVNFRADIVQQSMICMEEEKKRATANSRGEFTNRQRWRIPIIYIKVRNGRELSLSDAIIWKLLTKKLDTDNTVLEVATRLEVSLSPEQIKVGRAYNLSHEELKRSPSRPTLQSHVDAAPSFRIVRTPKPAPGPKPFGSGGGGSRTTDLARTAANPAGKVATPAHPPAVATPKPVPVAAVAAAAAATPAGKGFFTSSISAISSSLSRTFSRPTKAYEQRVSAAQEDNHPTEMPSRHGNGSKSAHRLAGSQGIKSYRSAGGGSGTNSANSSPDNSTSKRRHFKKSPSKLAAAALTGGGSSDAADAGYTPRGQGEGEGELEQADNSCDDTSNGGGAPGSIAKRITDGLSTLSESMKRRMYASGGGDEGDGDGDSSLAKQASTPSKGTGKRHKDSPQTSVRSAASHASRHKKEKGVHSKCATTPTSTITATETSFTGRSLRTASSASEGAASGVEQQEQDIADVAAPTQVSGDAADDECLFKRDPLILDAETTAALEETTKLLQQTLKPQQAEQQPNAQSEVETLHLGKRTKRGSLVSDGLRRVSQFFGSILVSNRGSTKVVVDNVNLSE
jgi:hypothetical protein